MGWKDWPYWLKGGILVGLIIQPILALIPFGLGHTILGWIFYSYRLSILLPPCEHFCILTPIGYILSFIIWFFIGALIIWIHRSLKKTKQFV